MDQSNHKWHKMVVAQLCLFVETDFCSRYSPVRSSPGSVWPKLCWCLLSCLPSAGCPVTWSTCTAPTTTTRWTPHWATSSPVCALAFWPSPTPVWTHLPSTWWAKALANTLKSSCCAALLQDACTVRTVGKQIQPQSDSMDVSLNTPLLQRDWSHVDYLCLISADHTSNSDIEESTTVWWMDMFTIILSRPFYLQDTLKQC